MKNTVITPQAAKTPSKKSVLMYDFLQVKGGAESVTLLMREQLNTAEHSLDIAVGYVNKSIFPHLVGENGIIEVATETNIMGWQTIKIAAAFWLSRKKFIDYDTAIFSGSNAPLAALGRSRTSNILYCHTPPRFVYDLKNHYLHSIPVWQRPLLRLLITGFQPFYERSVANIQLLIANSENVQQRIKRYLNRDAVVVYPPCDTRNYRWLSQEDFYLSTARLESYKRVKTIIEAFKTMPEKKLVVASGGSLLEELKKETTTYPNIELTGWCEQSKLYELVGKCIATLYLPVDEDFGMSPVESMAAGKPCIGVDEGGVKETVIDGRTGLLCPSDPTASDIVEAVNSLTPERALAMRLACEQQAKQFSENIFLNKMRILLDTPHEDLLSTAQTLCATNNRN